VGAGEAGGVKSARGWKGCVRCPFRQRLTAVMRGTLLSRVTLSLCSQPARLQGYIAHDKQPPPPRTTVAPEA